MEEQTHELSERKKQILKAIIEAHIVDGEPVGSKFLTENRNMRCSSATIRNEMSELERMGYLEQPHTSSGRVPSELGYRFYVDALLEHYAMTTCEIREINNLLKSKISELDQVLMVASKLASSMTNYTGFAIKPKTTFVSVKKFETIYFEPNRFILVIIASNGSVKTKYVRVNSDVDEKTVKLAGEVLNQYLIEVSPSEINLPLIMQMEDAMGERPDVINPTVKCIYDAMTEFDNGDVKVSGIDRLLEYPEFSDKEKLKELIQTLESKDDILKIVSNAEGDDVNVVIGSESSIKEMNNSTVVFKPITKDGRTIGAIGIIGPLRMDYGKVLATLEGLSGNISDILDKSNNDKLLNGGDKNGG